MPAKTVVRVSQATTDRSASVVLDTMAINARLVSSGLIEPYSYMLLVIG